MKRLLLLIIITVCVSFASMSQSVQGYIYDEGTQEPLVGGTVSYVVRGEMKGSVADENGFYSIEIPEGGVTLIYTFIGYEEVQLSVVGNRRAAVTRDIYMKPAVSLLQDVVVSAGRFEQKLNEITVSMDVMKNATINRQLPTDLGVILNTLPSVDVNDKQPSIRGGNGWTYGVGSRSLLLVDGMPVIGAASGDISWNMIPMENIEQVEVIKGASSVLYGSSALNGLINVRTGRPGLVPKTNVKYYMGIYGDPSNKDYIWWDKDSWAEGKFHVKTPLRNSVYSGVRNPMYEGFDISHTRRIGNFDVSAGMNFLTDEGYKEQGYRKRFRLGGNVTYHQPSLNIISYGVNYNFMSERYGDFLIWRSIKEAYQPSAFTNMGREGNTFNIDPFYNYTNVKNNTSHKVRGRFMYEDNSIIHASNSKNIVQILGNMGTDVSAITDFDLNSLLPLIPPTLEGNLNGAIDGLFDVLGNIFPTATTSDYCDLIAWLMNNGVPSGTSDLIPWGTDAIYPKTEKTYVDKNYTYYLDYQFHKKFKEAQITTGATYHHVTNDSHVTGTHNSDNISVFFQYDHRFFERLSLSLGVRGEYYRVDEHKKEAETKVFGTKLPFKPVFRGGINYQLAEYSFIRASAGQGYRYPSLTEKYARKDIGGVGVYPNYDLKAETGYNAELGFLQGYKIGNLQGFLDIAGFYTQYKNMIEFSIGFFNNSTFKPIDSVSDLLAAFLSGSTPGLGAQFYNVGKARIYGLDVSTNGTYNISPGMRFLYNIGYVYIQPEDPDYKKKNEMENEYTDPLQMKEKSNPSKYLKYRQKHTIKGTVDYEWNRFNIGINFTWKSRILAADYIFVDERSKDGQYEIMDYVRDILFGYADGENLASYWRKKNKDYFTMDLRTGVKATDKLQFQFLISNLFNKEYSTRPMAIAAPRSFVMTVGYNF